MVINPSKLETAIQNIQIIISYPDGAKAIEKWLENNDVESRYNVRVKDIGEAFAAALSLQECSAYEEDGKLAVETRYGNLVWNGVDWVEDEEEDEDFGNFENVMKR